MFDAARLKPRPFQCREAPLGRRPRREGFVGRGRVGPVLHFVDDRVGFEREERVIHARLEVDAEDLAPRADLQAFRDGALLVEDEEGDGAAEHDPRFVLWRIQVTVRGNVAIRLHGVEHAVKRGASAAVKGLDDAPTRAAVGGSDRPLQKISGQPTDGPGGRRQCSRIAHSAATLARRVGLAKRARKRRKRASK
jgi:hypothetical protein